MKRFLCQIVRELGLQTLKTVRFLAHPIQDPNFYFASNACDYTTTTLRMSKNFVRFGSRFLTVSPIYVTVYCDLARHCTVIRRQSQQYDTTVDD